MRKFKCSFDRLEVDLDDPKTYDGLPQNVDDLRNLMFREIGYSYCYMKYFRKGCFGEGKDGGQTERVELLIKNFSENEKKNRNNVLWYQEQVYLFQDEIENMC